MSATTDTDLGLIKINSHVYVSLIPTVAQSIIVKYEPEIQVSCVIPPRDYEISYSAKHSKVKQTLTVKSPTLIMSCGYGDVPTPETYRSVAHGYGLFVYDESRKNQIWAKPYLLANIWDRGQICFGTLRPGSLRQAFNYYWSSGFNTDLLRNTTTHVCKNRRHDFYYHTGCNCEVKLKHSCDCPKEISHFHYGCGCSTVALSKKCKGSCGKEAPDDLNKNCTCCVAIGKVIQKELKKDPKLSKKKLTLLTKQAEETGLYSGCGCTFRHKKICPCRAGRYYDASGRTRPRCNCPCECNCCLKKCAHSVCVCACCKNTCGCRCQCSEVQKLAQHLEKYQVAIKENNSWINYTSTFCGTKYWATPKSADGILVSNNKNLLTKIPREFWRKDRNGQPLVICLANKTGETWKFESGGYSFSLHEGYVITK